MVDLVETLKKRYTTKSFDSSQKIDSDLWEQLEEALILSPSSTNSQPWHFFVTDTNEGKKRLIKGTEKFQFNSAKILNASHVVLFCAKTDLSDEYLLHILDKEDQDGRFQDATFKEQVRNGRNFFVNIHRKELNDMEHWTEKQVYLNVGNCLLSAALLGIDAVVMEGIDKNALNEEFQLSGRGLNPVVIIAFGYRSKDDFNANLPKSRLEKSELIYRIVD